MRRTALLAMALIASASAASAVTLVVESDKLTYGVGETVVLTVTGDPQGSKDGFIFGELVYSAALTTTLTSSQTQHTRGAGSLFALTGVLRQGDGFATVFNQMIDPCCGSPRTVDNIQIATATLIADAAGIVEVFWSDDLGVELDFFGLTSGPGASFTIVPEPTAIALFGLGLLALAARHRFESPDRQKRSPTA